MPAPPTPDTRTAPAAAVSGGATPSEVRPGRLQALGAGLRHGTLPPGALSVGAGLAIQGVTVYAYLAIAKHALGADGYSPLAALWALIYVAAPGLFVPLEQEVGRALSVRRVVGLGGRPVLIRAGLIGLGLVAAIVAIMGAVHGPVVHRLFDGQGLLLVGFAVAIASYSVYFLARGALAGNARFAAYGQLLVIEGLIRVVLVVALWGLGVRSAGVFSLAIGVPSVLALVPVLMRERRGLAEPGPPAAWSEISSALTLLLLGSLLAQTLLNIVPLAVKVIATDDAGAAGRALNGLIVARIPLFFFQAIQASLLPRLAAQAAGGHFVEFRRGLGRLLLLLAGLVVLSVAGMALVGPPVVHAVFPDANPLSRGDLALLALGSETMMLGFCLAQGCIALRGYGRAAAGWAGGCVAVGITLALVSGVVVRAEVALCAGVLTATALLGVMFLQRLRALTRSASLVLGAAGPVDI